MVAVTPRFCGVNPKHKTVLDELERECLRVRAMEVSKAPEPDQTIAPRNPAGRKGKESVAENKNGNRLKVGTNSRTYRISKLKRDHPEVAKRVEAGEFTQAIQDETGKTPKAWYEEKLRPAHAKIATAQADPESGEFVSPKGAAVKGWKDERSGNTASLAAERNSKPQILRRLARERPDLLDRYERGDISANRAAIEAGFRKPPKPRPTTPLELLERDHPTRIGARPTAAATFCRRANKANSSGPDASSSTRWPSTTSATALGA